MICTKETVKALGLNLWVDSGSEGTEPQVDIILVQGLNAHPYYTWTGGHKVAETNASSSKDWTKSLPFRKRKRSHADQPGAARKAETQTLDLFWPRDLLPSSLPPCTISTYSYKSDWTSRERKTDLRKCGEQLLNVIYQDRLQRKVPGRPLVLVGHSLGGLVIQQALVLAKHKAIYQDVRESVGGFILLGSPLQGCDAASFAAWATRAVGNNQPLLKSLVSGSNDLLSLLRDFWDGYADHLIICFYEDQESTYGPGLKIKMVDAQSATPIGARRLHLTTDHSGLNKFKGLGDENFQLFLPALQEVVNSAIRSSANISLDAAKDEESNQGSESSVQPSWWLVPFARDSDFVSRAGVMERIDDLLSDHSGSPRVALSGLGGVGKSQIVIEYAYRKRKQSPQMSIFWVYASSPSRFRMSYEAIANEVRIPGFDDPKADYLTLIYRWLLGESSGEWLLIVDNADDIDFLRPSHSRERSEVYEFSMMRYLPQRAGGSILFTSRSSQVAFAAASRADRVIPITAMTETEAQELIGKKLSDDRGDTTQRAHLAHQLDLLPLAINQAVAYIVCSRRMTVEKYLNLFNSSDNTRVLMLSEEGADLRRDPEVPNSVIRTWELSFSQIRSRNPLAADILSCMALFNRQDVPEFLLRQKHDKFEFDKAIEVLLGFAFLIVGQDDTMFSMHRLVHLSTLAWLRSTKELSRQQEIVLKMLDNVYPMFDFNKWSMCQRLEPHALSALQNHYGSDELNLRLGLLSSKRSHYLLSRGKYALAEKLALFYMNTCERMFSVEHPLRLHSMQVLACVLEEGDKHKDAEELRRQVLMVCEKSLGGDDPARLDALVSLATVLRSQKKYDEAKEMLTRVVMIGENMAVGGDPRLLVCVNGLSQILLEQGHYKEAEGISRWTLEASEKISSHWCRYKWDLTINFGRILSRQGKHYEAEGVHRQVLLETKRTLGPEHIYTFVSTSNLAITLADQGRYEEAVQMYRQLLQKAEPVLGGKHYHILSYTISLALALDLMQDYKEALSLYRRAWNDCREVLGDDHPLTQSSGKHVIELLSRVRESQEDSPDTRHIRSRLDNDSGKVSSSQGGDDVSI